MPTIPYKNKVGKRIPGVTTIISKNLGWNKQALMYWANQVGQEGRSHRDVAGAAADAGTCGHYLVDCYIKGREPDSTQFQPEILDQGETCLINFMQWAETFDFHAVETEVHLVSEEYQFGATPDCIAMVRGKLSLLDWKTGNGVYPDHMIQLAAYRKAWEENHPDQPLDGGYHLLRIGKADASFHHHWWQDLSDCWCAFQYLLGLEQLSKTIKA